MTTEYTTYACTACKKQLSMAELMNHTCQITEDRVRSLIAEALTEKEDHIRRIWREEHAKHVKRLVSEKELLEQTRDEALEEAASVSNGYVYEPCCFAAVESMSKRIRSLKHARPDQARQGEEALHKAPNLGPDLGDRTERPSPASSLREFVGAADTMRRSFAQEDWREYTDAKKRYDTARSRIDVEEFVKDRDALLTNWRENRKRAEHAEQRLEHEIRRFQGADRGRADAIAERDTLRTELAKANEALDVCASVFTPLAGGFYGIVQGTDVGDMRVALQRTGRLGGSK